MNTFLSAIVRNDIEQLKHLIEAGEDINMSDKDGGTPLMQAVVDGKLEIVKILLENNANVNTHRKDGNTALHFATQNQQDEIARKLIEAKAFIDPEDMYGNSPLFKAVYFCNDGGKMVKLLLDHGADKHHKNKSGVSPDSLARTIDNYDTSPFN
jgi:ankyrin repeat protein